jgi:hypothetical protein
VRAFGLVCAALIASGTLFSIRLHTVFDKHALWTRDAEGRYLEVLDALPPRGFVLYVHDLEGNNLSSQRLRAQYAAVPRVVVDDPSLAQVALADLWNPAHLEAAAARVGMRVVKRSRDGQVAVLAR